ncbi:uncharacterized protein SCHCODRAFT_02496360, partial [Schizophyllum commune H4-8]
MHRTYHTATLQVRRCLDLLLGLCSSLHCSVSADTIDDALNVSAGVQLSCFRMREKFDLVVMYDNSSTSFDRGSPLYVLYEAIYTTYTGPKTLKRPPMMLVGGIEAWRRDFGAAEL